MARLEEFFGQGSKGGAELAEVEFQVQGEWLSARAFAERLSAMGTDDALRHCQSVLVEVLKDTGPQEFNYCVSCLGELRRRREQFRLLGILFKTRPINAVGDRPKATGGECCDKCGVKF